MPDGGYVLAGYQFAPSPQKSWIVRTDSMGVTVPVVDCETVNTSLPELATTASEPGDAFAIYPNPASNLLYLPWHTTAPPTNSVLYIYDLHGRLVHQHNGSLHTSIALPPLPAGIYCVRAAGFDTVQKLFIY